MDVRRAKPIATLDLAQDVLIQKPEQDMLPIFELSDVYSSTLPGSGTWDLGSVYELPTPVLRMAGTASSFLPTPVTDPHSGNGHARDLGSSVLPTPSASNSHGNASRSDGSLLLPGVAAGLMPTPTARDSEGSGGSKPYHRTLTDATVREEMGTRTNPRHLLKTPTSQLAVNGGSQHPDKRKAGGHGPTLADEVEHLLPTPVASDVHNPPSPERARERHDEHPRGQKLSEHIIREGVLLPTPVASEGTKGGTQNSSEKIGQLWLSNAVQDLDLLPTPAAMNPNDGESLATWEARRQKYKKLAKNGNGFGTPLAIAVQRLPAGESTDPPSNDGNMLSDE